jgi:hypothetical protein
VANASGPPSWKLGGNHTAEQWKAKMHRRGWTAEQITEAIQTGQTCGEPGESSEPANASHSPDDRPLGGGG